MSRKVAGTFQWVKTAGSTGNDEGTGIGYDNNGNIYSGGVYDLASTFGSLTLTADKFNNGFVAKLGLCGLPTVTCPSNQTVTANPSCQYTLLDYTSLATASAPCGIQSIKQLPIAGTIVGLGVTPVTIYLTD